MAGVLGKYPSDIKSIQWERLSDSSDEEGEGKQHEEMAVWSAII